MPTGVWKIAVLSSLVWMKFFFPMENIQHTSSSILKSFQQIIAINVS